MPSRRKHPVVARVGWGLLALLMVGSIFIEFFNWRRSTLSYELSPRAQTLLSHTNSLLAQSLAFDTKSQAYNYNEGYQPATEVAGGVPTPKFTGSFSMDPEQGALVTDPVNQVAVRFKPQFDMASPKKDVNRLIYPLTGRDGLRIFSLMSIGMKEDILLNSFQGDELSFAYKLELPSGTEARMEPNGSLAIYGAQKELLGNVTTGTEKDAELLQKARDNAPKKTLLFTFPAPFIKEFNKKVSDAKARYELEGDILTLHASGLEGASYPLSVDPSVYIETAAKLMRGNNETNVDFDVNQELIQKSPTTGARIDEWTSTLGLNETRWNQGVAVAGGYMYSVGGTYGTTSDDTAAYVRDNGATGTSTTLDIGSASTNRLVVVMADDESIGTNLTGATVDGKACTLVTRADNPEGGGNHLEMWYCDEDNLGSSNGTVTVAITGGDASWAVHAHLYTGVSQSGPSDSGIDNTSVGGTTVTVNGIDVPQNGLAVMGAGNGQSGTWNSWTSPLTERSDGPNPTSAVFGTASAIETSAQTNKTYVATASTTINRGAGIVGSWDHGLVSSGNETRAKVFWAHFNTSNNTVESPNPGAGACTNWCTNSVYDLPDERAALSVVTYNGFLYAIGGVDSAGTRSNDIYIAKLGANGEPSLWHPTDTNPNNWVYWFQSTGTDLSSERSYTVAVAYNNRLYVLGGQTNAATTGVTTVEVADILPNGKPGTWTTTGMQALPAGAGRHMHSVQVYNDTMYAIGGFEGAATSSANLRSAVYYSRLNSDGTMNAWQSTSGFATPRAGFGGAPTAIWGGYVYLGGGCTAVNGSGYCTAIASDVQLASINADGSLSEWNTILGLTNQRIGYSFVAWQNGLYRVGGCSQQNASTGACVAVLDDVDYGVVNPDGEASTVGTSFASGAAPCSGAAPYSCDLPSASVGNMLNASVIVNGYLYIMGGCTNNACTTYSSGITYQSIGSDGTLQRPASCTGTYTDSYCVSSVTLPNALGAPGTAVFNGRIYLVGGFPTIANISHISVNNDGSLGTWTNTDFTTIAVNGIDDDLSYTFAYARANPSSAGSVPGNLYIFGGCTGTTSGVGCSSYSDSVYKCNLSTAGVPSNCTITGQVQIGTVSGGASGSGLGAHAGAVYANYIYLMGGLAPGITDLTTVRYAKFDDSNNVVDADGVGSTWIESASEILVGRRRGAGFGYNGYLYVTGGYDGSEALADIEFAKIDVSTGDIGAFTASTVSISRRWGLTVPVSNSYAYVIGGCTDGAAPSSCTTRTNTIQTFQIYNNDSGAIKSVTSLSDDTFAASTDRWGASATVLNGYLYVAGGCIVVTDCSGGGGGINATADVQYAAISAANGSIGSWASATNVLPAVRAWGKLVTAGGTLYYLGGQSSTATDERAEVYYVSSFSSGNINAAWSTASGGIGDTASQAAQERTKFSAAVWDNRIYVVGGLNVSAAVTNTVYISPQLNSGGNIAANSWASDTDVPDVSRFGAALVAYANNLYQFGGNDGTNYLNDGQYASLGYKTGTISQSGTTVTGTGTAWTSAQVGSTLQYKDGSTATITGFTSGTSITVSASKTVTGTDGSVYVIQDGSVGAWTFTTSTPGYISQGEAFAANGYVYLVGGRSAASSCAPNTLIAPISANTTIVTGNNPTGVGEWYETNVRYAGGRYGAAVAYDKGKVYVMGGGCTSPQAGTYSTGTIGQSTTTVTGTGTTWTDNYIGGTLTYQDASTATIVSVNSTTSLTVSVSKTVTAGQTYSIAVPRHTYGVLKSQPQVAKYSRMIDTDTDVFPNSWLMNGLDNSIGARWQVKYRSMHDLDALVNPNEDCGTSATMTTMTGWGQETNFGNTTLGKVETYTPKDSTGGNINCARYYYFSISIDASQTFGYPEDVNRGPTIYDISLFFTSDPSKRLRHGKTFTGGEQQPLDTPCRVSGGGTENANCPLP